MNARTMARLASALEMLAPVVQVDGHLGAAEDALVGIAEVRLVLEHMARGLGDVDARDRRMQCGGVGRVADAKPDDEGPRRVRHGQQRDVRQCSHVALIERRGRRHRMAIGEEAPAASRYFDHLHELGGAFTGRQHPFPLQLR
jgi:hypothetical protein